MAKLEPVGAIIIHRHGKTRTEMSFPRTAEGQGSYPLTQSEKARMRRIGQDMLKFILRQPGAKAALRTRGVSLRGAPTTLARAIQTAHFGGKGILAEAKKRGIKSRTDAAHGKPVSALEFIQGYPFLHYPEPGSPEDKLCLLLEKLLGKGETVIGKKVVHGRQVGAPIETMESVMQRTKAVRTLRNEMAKSKSNGPFRIIHYASHGTAKPAHHVTQPLGPTGAALSHLFSDAEKKRFGIPHELVRGEAVCVLVYPNGAIRARHFA